VSRTSRDRKGKRLLAGRVSKRGMKLEALRGDVEEEVKNKKKGWGDLT